MICRCDCCAWCWCAAIVHCSWQIILWWCRRYAFIRLHRLKRCVTFTVSRKCGKITLERLVRRKCIILKQKTRLIRNFSIWFLMRMKQMVDPSSLIFIYLYDFMGNWPCVWVYQHHRSSHETITKCIYGVLTNKLPMKNLSVQLRFATNRKLLFLVSHRYLLIHTKCRRMVTSVPHHTFESHCPVRLLFHVGT